MTAATSATVRVMSPEEIASRAGGETAYLRWPEPRSVFAERAMRLTQLAKGHAMGDYLAFVSAIAQAQQQALDGLATRPLPLPEASAVDDAALRGLPPLAALDWPRDPVWHELLRAMCESLRASAPAGVQPVLARIAAADDTWLERQADAMLAGTKLAQVGLVGELEGLAHLLQVCLGQVGELVQQRREARGLGPGREIDRQGLRTLQPLQRSRQQFGGQRSQTHGRNLARMKPVPAEAVSSPAIAESHAGKDEGRPQAPLADSAQPVQTGTRLSISTPTSPAAISRSAVTPGLLRVSIFGAWPWLSMRAR